MTPPDESPIASFICSQQLRLQALDAQIHLGSIQRAEITKANRQEICRQIVDQLLPPSASIEQGGNGSSSYTHEEPRTPATTPAARAAPQSVRSQRPVSRQQQWSYPAVADLAASLHPTPYRISRSLRRAQSPASQQRSPRSQRVD